MFKQLICAIRLEVAYSFTSGLYRWHNRNFPDRVEFASRYAFPGAPAKADT